MLGEGLDGVGRFRIPFAAGPFGHSKLEACHNALTRVILCDRHLTARETPCSGEVAL